MNGLLSKLALIEKIANKSTKNNNLNKQIEF